MKEAGVSSKRRRILRVVMWLCAASALLMVVSWIWGSFGSCSIGSGGLRLSVTASQLQLAIANQRVERWEDRWYFPIANAAVVMPHSSLRPTMPEATMTVGTPNGSSVSVSMRVISVPIWQALLVVLIGGSLLWRLVRREAPPGHCSACGYDLRGLGSGKCPECGEGFLAKLLAVASRLRALVRGVLSRSETSPSRA